MLVISRAVVNDIFGDAKYAEEDDPDLLASRAKIAELAGAICPRKPNNAGNVLLGRPPALGKLDF